MAFSPDGKTVLTGGSDRTARLWDVATGQPVGSPLRHEGEVMAVAYQSRRQDHPHGSADKMAQLWDAATGRPIGQPFVHQDAVQSVAFSPDGKTLLTGGDDATARLWDAATGKPTGSPSTISRRSGPWRSAPTAGPSSPGAATGRCSGGTRRPENRSASPSGIDSKVRAVAFSPDGRTVLTGSEDKTARLWDAVTNQPIGPTLVHQGPVVAVAFSPDGKTFLTASSDNTVRLWDADPGQPFGLIRDIKT